MTVSQSLVSKRYPVIRELGTGAFATVLLCDDLEIPGHRVAIKKLHGQFAKDSTIRERFEREADLASRLRHPNIVAVIDTGMSDDGVPFLVMEFVDGKTLRQLMAERIELSFQQKVDLLAGVGRGLQCAHALAMTHRDIKPDNILVDQQGAPRLTDFGVAKCWQGDVRLTMTGDTVGTPVYMSPEQFREAPVDARTDIYSLGIVAFELFSGSIPFQATTYQDMAKKHLSDEMPSLVEKSKELPPWIDEFVQLCTQKNPDHRYQNVGEVLADLQKDRRNAWQRMFGK